MFENYVLHIIKGKGTNIIDLFVLMTPLPHVMEAYKLWPESDPPCKPI